MFVFADLAHDRCWEMATYSGQAETTSRMEGMRQLIRRTLEENDLVDDKRTDDVVVNVDETSTEDVVVNMNEERGKLVLRTSDFPPGMSRGSSVCRLHVEQVWVLLHWSCGGYGVYFSHGWCHPDVLANLQGRNKKHVLLRPQHRERCVVEEDLSGRVVDLQIQALVLNHSKGELARFFSE